MDNGNGAYCIEGVRVCEFGYGEDLLVVGVPIKGHFQKVREAFMMEERSLAAS